jgi:hypothetical protein
LVTMMMENNRQYKEDKARQKHKIDGKAWSLTFTINTTQSSIK